MLNQVILVGRLTHDIVLEKCKDKDKFQEGKNYYIVGVKGRIQRIDSTSELQLIAEKVTFLSSKPKED